MTRGRQVVTGDGGMLGAAAVLALAARTHPVRSRAAVALVLLAAGTCWWVGRSGPARLARWSAVAALVLAVAGAESTLAERALRGLRVTPGVVTATVTLLRDPLDDAGAGGAVRVDVRLGTKHVLARAHGAPAVALRRMSAGRRVELTGSLRAARSADWRVARHLAGDLSVTAVHAWHRGNPLARLADAVRDRLLRSGDALPPIDRALFAGFLLGDARAQSPLVTDDFRGAGLSHLLVVSGQNVAFTLASFGAVLRSLGRRGRFAAVLGLLVVFAAATRFEPSVLRAATMAAFTALAALLGRPQAALRLLALTSIALLVIDPLLAWSIGFAMSVAACLGLAVITPRLAAGLRAARWPAWLAMPVATALGAELGVAVVLLPVFGGVPLVSLPANLLAMPAAEPVMGWGVVAGLPAGIVRPWLGTWPARAVHVPTRLALDWVRFVAARAAALPLGEVTPRQGALLSALAAVAAVARLRCAHRRRLLGASVLAFAAVLAAPLAGAPDASSAIARGADGDGVSGRLERHVDVLRLRHGVRVLDVLQGLRRARVRAVDLVVVESGGRPQAAVVRAIAARVGVGAVLVGERPIAGPVRPVHVGSSGLVVRSGRTAVAVVARQGGRLDVRIAPAAPPPARPMPAALPAVAIRPPPPPAPVS